MQTKKTISQSPTFANMIGGLVVAVTGITFVLSYTALVTVAANAGKTGALAYLWPLAIDLPIVVFSLSGLLAAHRKDTKLRAVSSVLVATATAATIYFNVAPNPPHWMVAAVGPIMYFASFEVFVLIIRNLRQPAAAKTVTEPATKPAQPVATKTTTGKTPAAKRRQSVAAMLAGGKTPEQIARQTGASLRTIQRDIKAVA